MARPAPSAGPVAQEAMPTATLSSGQSIRARTSRNGSARGAYRTGLLCLAAAANCHLQRGQRRQHACQRPRAAVAGELQVRLLEAPVRLRDRGRGGAADPRYPVFDRGSQFHRWPLADRYPVERDGGEREPVTSLEPVTREFVDAPGHAERPGRGVEIDGTPGRPAAP